MFSKKERNDSLKEYHEYEWTRERKNGIIEINNNEDVEKSKKNS